MFRVIAHYAPSTHPDRDPQARYGGSISYDYATVAYDANSGATLWRARYNAAGNKESQDEPNSIAVSLDGSRVFVTGNTIAQFNRDYATVAYEATTGAKLWVKLYNGAGNDDDAGLALAPSPDSSAVFVTGYSSGAEGNLDYTTLAYAQ